jgi:hypothetical protein
MVWITGGGLDYLGGCIRSLSAHLEVDALGSDVVGIKHCPETLNNYLAAFGFDMPSPPFRISITNGAGYRHCRAFLQDLSP